MEKSNKDSKGRKLKPNESQMADGRYRYRYTDKLGKRKVIYSWKLVETDKTPKGKKEDSSLREKERQIVRDNEDGINTSGGNITVAKYIYKYIETKPNLANSTKENYIHLVKKNVESNALGEMLIKDVRKSDILTFYTYLYKNRKFSPNTIQLYQNILFPTFQLAVDDSIIRRNPCKDCMKGIVGKRETTTKVAFTRDEQKAFLDFVKNDTVYSYYYQMFLLMLSTGMRIGETLGLTWNDIDFEKKQIIVNHQLLYKKKDGKYVFYVEPPKNRTDRVIPIKDDIIKIMKEYKSRTYFTSVSSDFEIDGYRNFVFYNKNGKAHKPDVIVRACRGIRNAYNRQVDDESGIILPAFSPHTMRHTFCTRMAENGMDVKVLQKIMGHKSITITMQVYNHADENRLMNEVEKINSALEGSAV